MFLNGTHTLFLNVQQFRGFNSTFRALELESRADRDKGFQVGPAVQSLLAADQPDPNPSMCLLSTLVCRSIRSLRSSLDMYKPAISPICWSLGGIWIHDTFQDSIVDFNEQSKSSSYVCYDTI